MLVSVVFGSAKVHTLSLISMRISKSLVEIVAVVQLRVSHMVDMISELVLDPRVRIVVVRHGESINVVGVAELRVGHVVHVIGKLMIDPRIRVVVVRRGENILVVSVAELRVGHMVHVIGKLMIDPRIRVVVVILVVRVMVRSVIIMLSVRFSICFMHFFSWVCVSVDMVRSSVFSVRIMIPRVEVCIGSVISNCGVSISVIVGSVVVRRVQFCVFTAIGVLGGVNHVVEAVLGMVGTFADVGLVVGGHVLRRMSHVRVVVSVVRDRLVEPVGGLMMTVVSVCMRVSRIVSIFVDWIHVVVMGNSIEIASVVVHMCIDESFWNVSDRIVRIGVLREGMGVFNVGGQVGMCGQFKGRLVHIV